MKGLRLPENKEFEAFFEIVQKQAGEMGFVYFVDSGEGRELFLEGIEGEDLSGWLIPEADAEDFERIWKIWSKNVEDDRWIDFYKFAIWELSAEGDIIIDFKEY